MPKSAFRTISRDHHSPMESSERAAGHRSCLNDLRRMLRLTLLSKVVAPLYQNHAYYTWLHYETRNPHQQYDRRHRGTTTDTGGRGDKTSACSVRSPGQ